MRERWRKGERDRERDHHLHQACLPPSRHRPVAGERLPLAAPPANPLPRSGWFILSTLAL